MSQSQHPPQLSTGLMFLMATTIAATAANLFYNQPLLPEIGVALGIDEGALGIIPSASQVGYAAAILFISPLGDRFNRKRITQVLSVTLVLGLLAIYFSPVVSSLILATFVVGLSANITQQLLPLAASLSTPESKGRNIATLMTGLTVGILLSRTLSGFIAEHFGWRNVYLFAAVLATFFGVMLSAFLPGSKPTTQLSYLKLLRSMATIFTSQPLLREAALTGALWFAAFNALWASLAIHVIAEPFFYTVQQAGLFGLVGLAGITGARVSGRLVNRWGAAKLIGASLVLIGVGFMVLMFFGTTLWGIVLGILLVDFGVFAAQIPNQVRVFSIDPKAQSRVNAIYMLCYYVGAALGSALGVKAMNLAGWSGLTSLALMFTVLALVFHMFKNLTKTTLKKPVSA